MATTRVSRRRKFLIATLLVAAVVLIGYAGLPFRALSFSQSAQELDAYDYIEITANVSAPHAFNPFTDAAISGTFATSSGDKQWKVDGFADSEDGSLYRVRFMPSTPGDYTYAVKYRQGWWWSTSTGTFHVDASKRRGPVRVDPQNRWHFIWEGTGEHYFFNGTTAYWLMGWRDESVIQSSIERLHRLEINRMRVTVAGRTNMYYGEPVMSGPKWTPMLAPWAEKTSVRYLHYLGRAGQRWGHGFMGSWSDLLTELGQADDLYHPGFNYSRFQVSYWQKFERALRFARDRDMVFSLVLDMNDSRVHPAAGSEDERRFIRYAIARFGAFSNVTWDLGDDLDQYRDDAWTRTTGQLIKELDPYKHLATSHPIVNTHQDRTSDWFDFTSFQEWSRNQHAFMLAQRKEQERLGRIIPQTNEEYGYEDHNPLWALQGSDSADTLRRTAWEIAMAGAYQTAGESARRGTHIWPDTGGGWMNGRGDETMTMLNGYAHMIDFFTSFEWWTVEPHDELVDQGKYCLARPGELYAIYLPHGGRVTVQLEPGKYTGTVWNASTGEKSSAGVIPVARTWTSPAMPEAGDWALVLQRTALF
jgi:Protein of unknown function (DUF4038)/Domain of unknown function (DUF5060)